MAQITYFAGLSDGDDTAESDTVEGDTAESDTVEGDTAESDTVEGDTAESDTAEGDTTEGDTTEGDTTEGDNLNLRRLKRKRADDDDQSGELVSVNISICNDATDGAHTPNEGGSDTAGINPRDLSDDERSVSDMNPGPVKIGPPKKGTKCQYNNGKRFH